MKLMEKAGCEHEGPSSNIHCFLGGGGRLSPETLDVVKADA